MFPTSLHSVSPKLQNYLEAHSQVYDEDTCHLLTLPRAPLLTSNSLNPQTSQGTGIVEVICTRQDRLTSVINSKSQWFNMRKIHLLPTAHAGSGVCRESRLFSFRLCHTSCPQVSQGVMQEKESWGALSRFYGPGLELESHPHSPEPSHRLHLTGREECGLSGWNDENSHSSSVLPESAAAWILPAHLTVEPRHPTECT